MNHEKTPFKDESLNKVARVVVTNVRSDGNSSIAFDIE